MNDQKVIAFLQFSFPPLAPSQLRKYFKILHSKIKLKPFASKMSYTNMNLVT